MARVGRPVLSIALCAALVGIPAAWLLGSSDVRARTSYQSPYTLEQNFSSALRLVRVDMGWKVTERDPEAAYLLFEYKSSESGGRVTSGSIEMVRQSDNVQVIVQLPQMPQYHEEVLATSLRKKVQNDHGDPPRQRPSQPARPDGGTDGSPGGDEQPGPGNTGVGDWRLGHPALDRVPQGG